MPNRIIREGILTSPKLAKLVWAEEVFYRRLLSVVDDYGRYYADPGMLRAACYPRQLNKVSDSDVGKWLHTCVDAALVRVYPAQDGERYLEVIKFDQQVRAKKSKFPDMLSTCVADAMQLQSNAHLDVVVDVDVDVDALGASLGDSDKRKTRMQTLTAWIADLDGDAILAADPIFDWAGKVGIPRDWIVLAWWSFEGRYTGDGQGHAKKYADWRATFRNAVKDDWLKLWYVGKDGYVLTTAGQQAQREMAA